ncbi:multidrug DMT transporter permease [Candidatus Latescibacterota bacterium]
MVIIHSYWYAVILCVISMLCFGSWANTQKLTPRSWPFQLFYWDYNIGAVILTAVAAVTLGSHGNAGRSFFADIAQAEPRAVGLIFLAGVIFNLSNLMIVAAIDLVGMAVSFPVGVGLSGLVGVIILYITVPSGNPYVLFTGVAIMSIAMVLDGLAYSRLPSKGREHMAKGIVISIAAGILMGIYYPFIAAGMSGDFVNLVPGRMGPYAAVFILTWGMFLSNFIWGTFMMKRPPIGNPVAYGDYFRKGNLRIHLIGILGGVVWAAGMTLNLIASGSAGFVISFGLGMGATFIGMSWGVFVWREFHTAPKGTRPILAVMFLLFIVGLVLITLARVL